MSIYLTHSRNSGPQCFSKLFFQVLRTQLRLTVVVRSALGSNVSHISHTQVEVHIALYRTFLVAILCAEQNRCRQRSSFAAHRADGTDQESLEEKVEIW